MITINNNNYKLGLVDTCILSRILNNPNSEMKSFMNKITNSDSMILPCITIWSVLELRARKENFQKFIDFFSIIPFCMLKTPDAILNEEFQNYPYWNKVDPILFSFSMFRPENESLEYFLNQIFSKKEVISSEKNWKYKWKRETLNNILSLKKNFISKNKNLNSEDAQKFINEALPQYVISHNPMWAKQRINQNEEIIFDAFPSAKAGLYTAFYRFYVANREPEIQDIFDILINNSVPYLDYVVTENFQADILRKIKKADEQFSHLIIETIKDYK